MIKSNNWPIAVCTWSLANDFSKLNALRQQTQLNHIHLALSPALKESGKTYLERIRRDDWNITAAMIDFTQEDYSTLQSIKATGGIVPDNHWQNNRKRVLDATDITAELGVQYLSFHAGFIDTEDPASEQKLFDRINSLADHAAEKNVQLLIETGQETASELKQFLEKLNHPALGVNFDPANMILYNKGNPIEAVNTLAPWIKHIHIKDAVQTQTPGTWGEEVVWGTGQVGCVEFLKTLKKINFQGALVVEREAGDNRLEDIKSAVNTLNTFEEQPFEEKK